MWCQGSWVRSAMGASQTVEWLQAFLSHLHTAHCVWLKQLTWITIVLACERNCHSIIMIMWEIAVSNVWMELETWNTDCILVCKIHKRLEMWFILGMWQCPTNFTICNGAQTWTIIVRWTGWCNTLSSSDGVVRWSISACITWCTSVLLRRVGPILTPLSLMSRPSKHGWGPPGGTRNIYRVGVVRELEVTWSTWWCGRKGCYEDKRIDDEYEIDRYEDKRIDKGYDLYRYGQTEHTCLQNLPTSQPTSSILVPQMCTPIEVLTCCVLEVCRVGQRSGVDSMLLPPNWRETPP